MDNQDQLGLLVPRVDQVFKVKSDPQDRQGQLGPLVPLVRPVHQDSRAHKG